MYRSTILRLPQPVTLADRRWIYDYDVWAEATALISTRSSGLG